MSEQKDFRHTDLVILSCLRENSREKLTAISKRVQLPVSTIFDRLHSYKRFVKHTTLVDFQKLGFGAQVLLLLKTKKSDRCSITSYLETHPNVNSVSRITNGFDYAVDAVFKTMTDVEDFLERVDEQYSLKKKEVFYVLNTIKRETFLNDPEVVPIVE